MSEIEEGVVGRTAGEEASAIGAPSAPNIRSHIAERNAEIIALYVRVCRDGNFKLDAITAAHLVGRMMRTTPLSVWLALGSMDAMERIANGTHPAVRSEATITGASQASGTNQKAPPHDPTSLS